MWPKKNKVQMKFEKTEDEYLDLLKAKKELQIDLEQLTLKLANEKEAQRQELASLKHTHKLEALEIQTLSKLKTEQEMAKVKLESSTKIVELESKYKSDISELKAKLAEEYFAKMQAAMIDLNKDGSAQAKFAQDLALTMMGKASERPLLPTAHTQTIKIESE